MNDPWIAGAALGAVLAVLLWFTRSVTPSGAITGGVLTTVFLGAGGWSVFSAFALLVVGGSVTTHLGRGRKPGDGRGRNAAQAIANAGPAALLLLLAPDGVAAVAAVAALGAAWSDTASSEIGLLARAQPRMLLVGPTVAAGRDGGMTWLGTAAGLVAAAVAAALAGALEGASVFPLILVGAFCGNVVDSVLGATVEQRFCCYGNEVVNALATAAGGCVAWLAMGGT